MWRLRTVSVSAVRVPSREHENEASVLNVHEVLVFTCARGRSYVLVSVGVL